MYFLLKLVLINIKRINKAAGPCENLNFVDKCPCCRSVPYYSLSYDVILYAII